MRIRLFCLLFSRTARTLGVLAFHAALVVGAPTASALVIDFDALPAGTVVTPDDLPAGYGIVTINKFDPSITDAIIFDSACPGGCTGGDDDLRTPGVGIGNDAAQNKILIVPEDLVDSSPPDGLIDDPDDEQRGGVIAFTFPGPRRVLSIRIVDIDTNETGSVVILSLSGGGTLELPIPTLGNNSAQTILVPQPEPLVDMLTVDFAGSGAIDDIVIEGICGDGVIDPGEECDPPDNGVTCDDDCQLIDIVSTTTMPETTTTMPETTTTMPETTTTMPETTTTLPGTTTTLPGTTTTMPVTTTTLPLCGNGVIDPGEQCDDGADNSNTEPDACREDCTLPFCGDGVVDDGEICDPPNSPEICNNMVDDDDNGLQDCEDSVPCPIGVETCGADCTLVPPCVPVDDDPAVIRFDTRHNGADYLSVHGNFVVDQMLDLTAERFAVRLSNIHGQIFQGTLAAAEFKRRTGGKGSYYFKDRAARRGGPGDADGFYKVSVRVRHRLGRFRYVFRVKAYGDFATATESLMTMQVVAGEYVGVLAAEWTATRRGWILRRGDFN